MSGKVAERKFIWEKTPTLRAVVLTSIRISEDMLHRNISSRSARTCRGSLSSDDVDRCGHREHRQDNTQAAYTAPRVNMWDNPIKRRPQL